MKYLCLVCYDEKTLDAMPKEEFEPFSAAHVALDEELRRSGRSIAAEALQPVRTAVTVRVRNGKAVDDRRPVRGDEGAARRDLPDRSQGPERRHPDRRADSVGGAGQHRGTPGLGSAPARAARRPRLSARVVKE